MVSLKVRSIVLSAPAIAGEGDHPKDGGGGAGLNASPPSPHFRHRKRPFHHPAFAGWSPFPASRGRMRHYSAAAFAVRCGARSRNAGMISSAIAVMLARAISFGMVPNWVLVSDVLKPARS